MRGFFTAVMFLTRLPVVQYADHQPDDLTRSVVYFPLVGMIVGAISGAVAYLVGLAFPPMVAVAFGLGATAIVTGCFHEDAFADVCDGFGGYEPKRRLEIMRDSRVGSFGVVGVVLLIAAKIGVITALSPKDAAFAFVATYAMGRWSILYMLWRSRYVTDPTSMAKPFVSGATLGRLFIGALIAVPAFAWFKFWPILPAFLLAIVITELASRFFRGWLGGITGDALGATNQVVELSCWMLLLGLQSVKF